MRRLISDHSLFTIPLWSIDGDAEVQPFPSTRYPNIHEEIVIPPSVEQYVSNIKECIDYVFDNAQYGPRKYSAMIESVQEVCH
ncbi:hypothetical protein KP509_01G090200 [Ceratopteris richardii]|uniref:Uncharacterized protein n=1 Tax=Ceratopteris richardii TaxID=49495 RepID=A0A8T2VF47_CERRI|nr:hypothetical protein KP509_01G090200 [Ceratopteris richardii]